MSGNPTLDLSAFHFPSGPVGCLLVHGFTGSPPEMRGLGEYLAAQGYTVRGPRLPGHGTSAEDMATTGARDWLAGAEADLRRLLDECQTVFVGGLSMGGLISLILASQYPVAGVISMATPARMPGGRRAWLLPVARYFVQWVSTGSETPDLTDPAAPGRLFSYGKAHVRCVVELKQLIGQMRHALPRITAPALIIQGQCDRSIPPESAQYIHDHIGSADKTLRFFAFSGHALTVDTEREAVWLAVGEFISRVTGMQ